MPTIKANIFYHFHASLLFITNQDQQQLIDQLQAVVAWTEWEEATTDDDDDDEWRACFVSEAWPWCSICRDRGAEEKGETD